MQKQLKAIPIIIQRAIHIFIKFFMFNNFCPPINLEYYSTIYIIIRQLFLKCFHLVLTVHKDITDRVEHINPQLARQVRCVLEVNKAERHIRGGIATKNKYLHMKK